MMKNNKPAAINKIQFDYADYYSRASHIISIGYSFPKDDISNSVFLKNMKMRKDNLGRDCKLSYIDFDERYSEYKWIRVEDIKFDANSDLARKIEVITDIFDKSNIRLNFSGFPGILDKMTLSEIMAWQ